MGGFIAQMTVYNYKKNNVFLCKVLIKKNIYIKIIFHKFSTFKKNKNLPEKN